MKVRLGYEGPLFGRVKGRYCNLVLTSKDVDEMESAFNDMLSALENLENDDGKIPDHAWELIQSSIAKAKGKKQ